MPHVAGGTGKSLPATPGKYEKRRREAASGGFLLDTFLCLHKEKYLVRGYENPHLKNRRVSDTQFLPRIQVELSIIIGTLTRRVLKSWHILTFWSC
jgi:hypothetical protein